MAKIPPGLRFDVQLRDHFTCRYCGRGLKDSTPEQAVVLEIDHVIPVADGGQTIAGNLVTACADCNRGKGTKSLGILNVDAVIDPADYAAQLAAAERRRQVLNEQLAAIRRARLEDLDAAIAYWHRLGGSMTTTDAQFLRHHVHFFPLEAVLLAMDEAAARRKLQGTAYVGSILRAWRADPPWAAPLPALVRAS